MSKTQNVCTSFYSWIVVSGFCVAVSIAPIIYAQTVNAQKPISKESASLTLNDAFAELAEVSDALKASDAERRAALELAHASRSLSLPDVSIDARRMRFKKSLDIPLDALEPQVSQLGIPNPYEFEVEDWRTRPIVTGVLPIYSGGKITAAREAAEGKVLEHQADYSIAWDGQRQQLIRAYFGQQLTVHVLHIREQVYEGLQLHRDQAAALFREGFASRAQLLQADVALDNAAREAQKAKNDAAAAAVALAGLLKRGDKVVTATPLFVMTTPITDLTELRLRARSQHPSLQKLTALKQQTQAQLRAKRADYLPQVYAFGQYDIRPEDALITESDWAFGVGVKYQLISSANRKRQLNAAKYQDLQVDYTREDALMRLDIGVADAFYALENARDQFGRLSSSIQQGEENLRLQRLSFREGQATSLDVIDARLSLGAIGVERALAAYQYDMALAQLLLLTGDLDDYLAYVNRADVRLTSSRTPL